MKRAAFIFMPLSLMAQAPVAEEPELREIAPPVEVFPYPVWMVCAAIAACMLLLVAIVWLARRYWPKRQLPPPPTPRELALKQLQNLRSNLEMPPYLFSILVSDVLRSFLMAQYGLPVTRQTSPEFLAVAAGNACFSPKEKALLEEFLGKTDLVKFARLDASGADSTLLLEQAMVFVKGEA